METPPPPIPPQQFPYQPEPPKKNNNVLWIVLGVLGVGCCGLFVVGAAILFPVFNQAKLAALGTLCLSRAKQQSTGVMIYSVDFDDRLPLGDGWMDTLGPYTKNDEIFHCSTFKAEPSKYGYAFHQGIAGKNLVKMTHPQTEILTYESTQLGRNALGSPEIDLPSKGRHSLSGGHRNMITYCDTHAKAEKSAE
ncbi:MAG: hypothetical protein BGO01_03255 [Armatimonadetes bacterium 55-13]|nr:hypothetical protein [Armatimonadota bacterium]OJU62976.1 MAG: hypothetical protein BGO01_03255 [Armatimonadetes bacterium 55-13]